jgi:ADP-ribose pyrophosphatase
MTSFTHHDCEVLAKERAFQGYFAIDKYTIRHRLFNGGWSEPFSRELFERGHATAVVLYDPVRDEVVLLEQFRIGALGSERSPWMIEIVAGIIEPGETPEAVAIRECYEEAGQEVKQIEYIGKYFCTPGGSSESITLFCARVDSTEVAGVYGLEHEQEDIRVFTMPLSEVRKVINEDYFENATSLIGMQWLLLNSEQLKERWLENS